MGNAQKFFIVLLIIVFGVVGWFSYKQNKESTPTKTDNAVQIKQTLKTYQSEQYGFSFSYPEPYEVIVSSKERITIGKRSFQTFDSLVSVSLIQGGTEMEIQSFEEFVLDQSRLECSSDTVINRVLCNRIDDVVKIAPYSTKSGVQGQVFYLKGEESDKTTNKSTTIRRGPFYTFNTSSNTPNKMSFLMINNPITKSPQDANLDLIQSVASSMTLVTLE